MSAEIVKPLRIGTRKSPLALKQTEIVIHELEKIHGYFDYEIIPIVTKGDRMQKVSLSVIGGKGVFIKEVEQALLEGSIDFAVHSLKDMPAQLAPGLIIGAIPSRADVRDCLIFREAESVAMLPENAVIGTSSLRRAFQVPLLRSDLQTMDLRGNVGKRLQKMEDQKLDGIILAAAGLERLGWFDDPDYCYQLLDPKTFIPAVGQAALAVQCRAEDSRVLEFLQTIDDKITRKIVEEERAFLRLLDGNCNLPLGAYVYQSGDEFRMKGFLGEKQTKQFVVDEVGQASLKGLGLAVGNQLLHLLGVSAE